MRAVVGATLVAAALVASYLALGGASYAPAQVADPCAPRDWNELEGFQEVAEQIVLSGIDGVACELGVSREEVVLAFASGESLDQFAREQGVDPGEVDDLLRTALLRAVDDAEQAGALSSTAAGIVRQLVMRLDLDQVLELLERLPGL